MDGSVQMTTLSEERARLIGRRARDTFTREVFTVGDVWEFVGGDLALEHEGSSDTSPLSECELL